MTAIENVAALRVLRDGVTVGVIPNLPGKQKSLQLFLDNSADGQITSEQREAIKAGFAELNDGQYVRESQEKYGAHPNIDLVVYGENFAIDIVTTKTPNLLELLVKQDLDEDSKEELLSLIEQGDLRIAEKVHDVRTLTPKWEVLPIGYTALCTYLDPMSDICKGTHIGCNVKIGAGSVVNHRLASLSEGFHLVPSILEDNVDIGTNCVIQGYVGDSAEIRSGVVLGQHTKVFDLKSGAYTPEYPVLVGKETVGVPQIPPHRTAVPGSDGHGTQRVLLLPETVQ